MILSHNDTSFQYRRQLLTAAVGLLAAVSILVPSGGWFERAVAPLKVIFIGACAYAAVFLTLRFVSSFMYWFAAFYALFCYYVGIVGLVLSPVLLALDPGGVNSSTAQFGSAEYFTMLLPQMAAGLFAAAAGYNWLRTRDAA